MVTGGTFNYNADKGINIVKTSSATFDGVEANYNNFGVSLWEWVSSSSNLEFIDSEFSNNNQDGFLFGTQGTTTIDDVEIIQCDIFDNSRMGVYFYHDYGGSISNIDIHDCNIVGNGGGVETSGLTYTEIDASCNWWGDISGPSGSGPGSGDSVGDYILYCLWLDDAYPFGSCIGGAVCRNIDTGEYFCRIQRAIDDSDTMDGHTIEVFAGTHPGNIIVYKELTIQSESGAASTIIDASSVDYSSYQNVWGHGINYGWAETYDPGLLKNGFMIWSDDVTIDGFTIINANYPASYNRGIGILIGSIHTTYAGFIPWNIDQWGGIVPSPDEPTPTGILIENNIINGASDGIYNWASSGNTIEYNMISNTDPLGGTGIQAYEGGTNNIIQGNNIDNAADAICVAGAWPDILLDVSNTQIYDNILTNNAVGIKFYNVDGSTVDAYHNDIFDNGKGIFVEGVGGALIAHANYNNIVGNTIGIENAAPDGTFDAECNWYGYYGGPTHSSNPLGIGDTVSDDVDFIPWLTGPYPGGVCGGGLCQDEVWVDDNYHSGTPGWFIDHFYHIQDAMMVISANGIVHIMDGTYQENVIVDVDSPYCIGRSNLLIQGEDIPTDANTRAVIDGTIEINTDLTILENLWFMPKTSAVVTINGDGCELYHNVRSR